jgi:GNAT superfamily N-acetyltransferase
MHAFLTLLPRGLRRKLILSRLKSDPRLASVSVGIIEDETQAVSAAELVHDAYVRRGILPPHPTGLHAHRHSASPSNWAFVATLSGRTVGTISMVVDSEAGLPMDASYRAELDRLRPERLAEVGALAIAPELRGSGVALLLMWAMYRTARKANVERLVIAISDFAEPFYRDGLLFDRIADARRYPGLDVQGIALASPPLETVEEEYRRIVAIGCGRAAVEAPLPIREEPAWRRQARSAIMRARPDVIPFRPSLVDDEAMVA